MTIQKQRLLLQALAIVIPVIIVVIGGFFAWYATVNVRLAITDNNVLQLKEVVTDLNKTLKDANIAGLSVRVEMAQKLIDSNSKRIDVNSDRLGKVENKVHNGR